MPSNATRVLVAGDGPAGAFDFTFAELVRRDIPYYSAAIAPQTVEALNRFARRMRILERDVSFEAVVAAQFAALWA